MAEAKATFAPLPARCMGDGRLSALDLRVLAAIAIHDRLGKNGIGCTAGHGSLAAKVGCHLKSLSRSIRTLAECGYLGGKANPLNPKYRAYFVIYNEFDEGFARTAKGNQTVTPTGNELVPNAGSRGNQLSENDEQNQKDASYNILGEAYNKSCEAFLIDPVETASNAETAKKSGREDKGVINVGAILADVERNLRAGIRLDPKRWLPWLESLCGADASLDINDPNYHRAQRLYEGWADAA